MPQRRYRIDPRRAPCRNDRRNHRHNHQQCHRPAHRNRILSGLIDNEIGWMDWSGVHKQPEMLRFFQRIIQFRKQHPAVRTNAFFAGKTNERGLPEISWHGAKLNEVGWDDSGARALGFTLGGFDNNPDLHVMMNMYWDALDMDIPTVKGRKWTRAVDTSLPSPNDIADPGKEVASTTRPTA